MQVPALIPNFIRRHVEDCLTLIPVREDPRLEFRSGEALPAERVLTALQRLAMEYNGLLQ